MALSGPTSYSRPARVFSVGWSSPGRVSLCAQPASTSAAASRVRRRSGLRTFALLALIRALRRAIVELGNRIAGLVGIADEALLLRPQRDDHGVLQGRLLFRGQRSNAGLQ